MRQIWLGCSLLALCLLSGLGFAQNAKVRVAVTVLGRASGATGAEGRDRLVKDLNKQKKSSVEAVAIEATGGEQISAEARQKNCEFVIFPTLTYSHSQSQAYGVKGNESNIPVYQVTIEYKLYRLADATPVVTGSAQGSDIGGEKDVVFLALDNVAKKVSADIMKAAAAPPAK
jgi:hypothetical protein